MLLVMTSQKGIQVGLHDGHIKPNHPKADHDNTYCDKAIKNKYFISHQNKNQKRV